MQVPNTPPAWHPALFSAKILSIDIQYFTQLINILLLPTCPIEPLDTKLIEMIFRCHATSIIRQ